MKKIIDISVCCLLLLATSCSDWLDVNPKNNIKEEELFSTEQGFKEALTGIYMAMCDVSLYGRQLTYGFMDILAQRYDTQSDTETLDYTRTDWYTFPSNQTENYTNKFWGGHYNIIANINNFLTNLETKGDVVTSDGYQDIMKGEMLGLRSFLYFDLLRMFGPVYKDNPSSPTLPYRTEFDRSIVRLMPASELVDNLIATLKEAERLLENDPMNISFPTAGSYEEGVDPFLDYRFNRMNKFAVKAVLARVYLYKGDAQSKALAADYADQVIKASKGNSHLFTLVTDNATDPVCSTELIFALSMDSEKYDDQIDLDFKAGMTNAYFIKNRDRVYELFDTEADGYNDMRMKEGQGFTISNTGSYTLKFRQTGLFSPAIENQMPLIRLPEMYYILAECTADLSESAETLSVVRSARGLSSIEVFAGEDEKMKEIEKEYRKELYGEGQLWYFYKRLGYKTFQFCPVNNMTESNYRFPIPDDEKALGGI
ncbi:RagB/SusD family nutrient uptake outer membrane protein [Bacteroides congonensis]